MSLESKAASVLTRALRGAFLARRLEARVLRRELEAERRDAVARHEQERREGTAKRAAGARNILFITVDQQRWDALGCNGGRIARTPHVDSLARAGLRYVRPHVQNVVCMPSRATMFTGQHPRTHGVVANGIALPEEAPNVARVLRREAGYRTALIGKAHFDPHLDPLLRFRESVLAAQGSQGPFHGLDHVELASHGPLGGHHYAAWLWEQHPDTVSGFAGVLTAAAGGDTGAPEVKHNPIVREHYHTDWVAHRAMQWLRSVASGERFFLWVSFPDPHHPFDPPLDEVRKRIDWRDVPLPPDRRNAEALLRDKPRHWLDWYEGRFHNPEGGPTAFRPRALGDDQYREMSAMIHVENELIDDAVGRLLRFLEERGLADDTDVVFTSDHGDLQGDFGLFFKGPYHVDALLRVPLLWRPASRAAIEPATIVAPVGLVDLAPTFCSIAGVTPPGFMEGTPLPTDHRAGRPPVLTTFDSNFAPVGMHLRTIFDGRYLCTAYDRSDDRGGQFPFYWAVWGRGSEIPRYDGNEGELYDCIEDPQQHRNLWSERPALRDELIADLATRLPPMRTPPLPFSAPT
ncbi:MAG: sulfatase-like hydrolase/transferase [Polyangiaceae bacterium]|nr:sulfatase-like hydrolase/transferase [Polyangiaceae bacterium]